MKSGSKAEAQARFMRWATDVGSPPTTVLATLVPTSVDPVAEAAARVMVGSLGHDSRARVERVAQLLEQLKAEVSESTPDVPISKKATA